jgi:chromosome segregation ATPase
MIFTTGNLITLAIVVCALIIFRLLDKNNRSIDMVRKLAEKSKNDIAAYAEEKGMAVRNFGINLEVEQKAAIQLMNEIQHLTEEKLAKKSEAITRIEDHLKAFESSLDELFGMTGRVQENLSRIRDESAFVENTNKRVTEAKSKFEQVDKALEAALKNLETAEERLEKKNVEVLEQTAKEVIMSAKSHVSDFEATAQVIERKIGEHREAVLKTEREREAVLAHEMDQIKKILKDVLENAGKRADKLEEAALLKLKEQAQERITQIKTFFEEKIKTTQDSLKTELGSVTEKLKTVHDKCNTDIQEIGAKQKNYHQEWTKGTAELDNMAKKQKDDIINSLARHQNEISNALSKEHNSINSSLQTQQNDWNLNFQEFKKSVEKQKKELDTSLNTSRAELNQSIIDLKTKSQSALKQQHEELDTAIKNQHKDVSASLTELKEKTETAVKQQHNEIDTVFKELSEKTNVIAANQYEGINSTLTKQMETWKVLCRDTEQNIISANEKRLDDYNKTYSEAVNHLSSLADDAAKLDTELRRSMQEVVSRVNKDFAAFERESGVNMETASNAFDAQAKALRKELEEMDKELNGIRQQAYNNVSEKLTSFENEFTAELGKRASEIGRQIADWQSGLQERFTNSEEKITHEWHTAEERILSDQRKNITIMGERLLSDLERLKHEASAFEMGIREEMNSVDEAHASVAKQLEHNLAEMRVSAENEVKAQVGQYQITMQEVLRQKQRELEKELEDISQVSSNAYAALDNTARNTRQSLDDWQASYMSRMREMDDTLEKIGRHSRETADENNERILFFRTNLEDIRKELDEQKKIFNQTEELKTKLDRRIEETRGDLDRLDQRKSEIAQLENDLNRVKRIEDEVNNKMTRFLTESRRIELMEESFNRLIKTSAEVEDKLKSITSSNDILQAEQIKIRKLEESIKETEDKYQRIEKKNEVLEETTEAIDRNFKSLQKTETAIKTAENVISVLSDQFDSLRSSIELLAAQDAKASNAVDKIDILEESLAKIEKRIADMNVAREWLANVETRLNELYKEAKEQIKLIGGVLKSESGKTPVSEGAPPPQVRDNIRRLHEQGWKVEEIAKTMKRSVGEIELTLEIITRG